MSNFRLGVFAVRFLAVIALVSLTIFVQPWPTSAGQPDIEELDQKVRILERRLENAQEEAATKAKQSAVVGADKGGFFLKSADGNFQLKLRGYTQLDGRYFKGDKDTPVSNTFLFRTIRPILDGTVAKHFSFRIMPDFSSATTGGATSSIVDAYLDFTYWPQAKLRVGKFRPPVGIERLQGSTELNFLERGLPTNLVPNRDVGLQVFGESQDGVVSYAAGVFNGVVDVGSLDSDNNDDKEISGRVFFLPFKGKDKPELENLGLGVSASRGIQKGSTLPSYKTPGQQTFFSYGSTARSNGVFKRVSPQGYFYQGPFGLIAEYVRSSHRLDTTTPARAPTELKHKSWQVAGSFVLTGEDASYKAVKPLNAFDPANRAWGAVELAARYGVLEIDPQTFPTFSSINNNAHKAKAWAGGVNWYLNNFAKFVADYELTKFTDGDSNGSSGNREDERIVFTRFQIAY